MRNNNKYLSILIFMFLFVSVGFANAQEFKIIRDRIAKEVVSEKVRYANKNRVRDYMNKINEDGSFSDVNYADKSNTNWAPLEHLKRLELLSTAYTTKGNDYYENKELFKKIETGLFLWTRIRPKSDNWWHNDISSPKLLGRILIVMSTSNSPDKINPAIQRRVLAVMKDTQLPETKTGANKVDIAIHNIYRAAIEEDKDLMTKSAEFVYEPVTLTENEEGIQYDYSYFQHGPQLHISSYGSEFVKGAYGTAYWFVGTPYALPKEKADVLNKFFFNTYVSGIRGRNMDFNLEGRGISRQDALDKSWIADFKNDDNLLNKVAMVAGSAYNKEIENIRKRLTDYGAVDAGITPEHIYFWRGDYTIHKRPKYSFNVRTVSTRTRRTEKGNNENLLGTTLPDGSTNIQVSGGEYRNIMPFWEWDKVPGVTARDHDVDREIEVTWGKMAGASSFVGGVSDGVYGATVYTQDYDDVKAKKSYFFFDEAVVCLGSDISSTAKENVTTTLNQTYSRGDVLGLQNGQISPITKKMGEVSAEAIWHNDIAYVFPKKSKVYLSNETQRGSWGKINKRFSLDELEDKIFKLWIDEGVSPTNATYEYIVLPGISKDELMNNYSKNIKILENNGKIQAVEDTKLNITQAVFFEKGTLKWDSQEITVDKPCILQVRQLSNNSVVISIADPNQIEDKINVVYSKSGIKNSFEAELPQAPYRGKTVHKTIK